MSSQRTMTFGIVVGNRGFFPDHLAKTGREEIISLLQAAGAKAIVLGPEDSKYGAVETYAESKICAELFKKRAEEIDGMKAYMADITPIKRLGNVEEIAEGFLYLASDDSSFMVGGDLVLDGGFSRF